MAALIAETLPAWTTVLLALITAFIGGGLGAIVVALLRGRHERAEAWRDRLVRAADDFATGVMQAMLAGRDAKNAVRAELMEHNLTEATLAATARKLPPAEQAIDELERRADEAHARLARVQILFGAESEAAKAGQVAIDMLRRATLLLREEPIPSPDSANKQINQAHDAHLRFAAAARAAIERGTID